MAYSIYRIGLPSGASESLLAGEHGFGIGNYEPQFVLKPTELVIEFQDQSVDGGVHNRTEIHRYAFGAKGVTRLDPVAFQSQDFAEEWLTRPWSEMQSRSKPATEEWHSKLHSGLLFAEYSAVVLCRDRPGRWLIAPDIKQIGKNELPVPLTT
jgi:hypothetical protein